MNCSIKQYESDVTKGHCSYGGCINPPITLEFLKSNSDSIGRWKRTFPPPSFSFQTPSHHLQYCTPQPLAEAVPVWSANYSLSGLQQAFVWICMCVYAPTDANRRQAHTVGRKEAAVDWASTQGAGGMKTNCCCDVWMTVCVDVRVGVADRPIHWQTVLQLLCPRDGSPGHLTPLPVWTSGPPRGHTHTAGTGQS